MINVRIVAPDQEVFSGSAESLRAPGVEGSFQVLTGHAPMIAAIETGPLLVEPEGESRIAFATSGGFVEVLDDEVTVLAETAEPASEIDEDRAREAQRRAEERLDAGELDTAERERHQAALERARNRLRVSMGNATGRS
ncbi:MAG: ATP synthase F1 subunit epsilon [Bacteroidetes bacterium QS_9_68_14]|nr:MAG: ATP synthase F1 subunit epsilon [Bacteroidetes bacterium QS_9_68_14]